ncbi:extracellular solute-binding protein, family 3 [Andreprevotia lacus DSM 23236]|uniref:Extracellular solute-binding protein, family 3 n=1 Tax=Andreprevotia lacus DSM 23236 TaxID=1121001 RepID=A0A1W1XQU2_9NEIS|nr:extracellular solute-binding protein, family 3 [Andreprevotia lacus DSM 23236]
MQKMLATLCLLLGAQSALCGDFTVGVEAINFYPLYDGTSAQYQGYGRDVLDSFARKYGHRFRYVALPVERLYQRYFHTASLDFKFPDNPAWQEQLRGNSGIAYSGPVYRATEGLFVLPTNSRKSLRELGSISTMRGFGAWPYHTDIANGVITIQFADTLDSLLALVRSGRAGGVFYEESAINWQQRQAGLATDQSLVLHEQLPHYHPELFLSTRTHPEVIAQFDQFLQEERPLLQSLKAKYGLYEAHTQQH